MDTFDTEKDRYKEVYLSTGYALLNFARKFVPEFYAEDIVHDVYLRFWDKQIYKLPNEELRSLLYTAVRNACIDHLRKLQTEQEFIDQHAVQLTLEEICLYESSEEKIMKKDLFLQFLKQSEALPERTRQVFKLSYVDGLRNNEIAEQLASCKKQRGGQDKRRHILLLLGKQRGRDEFPYLVKNEGAGQHQGGKKSDFHIGEESLRQAGENQVTAFGKSVRQRLRDDGKQVIFESITGQKTDAQRDQRVGQPFAQLDQMFGQRHFKIFVGFHHAPVVPGLKSQK